jgi:uncharacterized repeat protein (TIGR01451 family)
MGHGRWLSGRSMGRKSRRTLVWVPILGAMFVLLLAGCVLLERGSRRYAQKAMAPVPASPIPSSSGSSPRSKPDARAILGQLPLIFEPNQGQADPRVKFLARGAGYSLFLDTTGAVLAMQTAHSSPTGRTEQFVRMKLVGANPAAATAGTDPLPGKSNYLIGNDPHLWHTGIPQFAGVHYASVYPGIDLVFYGNHGDLEYDFRVAPGADPSQAELQFNGAAKLELNGGDLILTGLAATGTGDGGMRLQAPHIYQRDGDHHKPVAGRFVLRAANRVGFEIGPYDRSRELIIDPALNFSTYFGGSGSETSPSVAVNGDGFIYLVGTTQGSPENSFPTAATQTLIPPTSLTSSSPSHIFVAKISPSQPSTVVYETFLGGSGSDNSVGIGVDNGGSAFIVGNTTSPDFPHAGIPYQSGPATKGAQCASITCTSVFVSVLSGLDPTGATLKYSSYLSGNGNDQASGMTTDTQGDVFITGATTSNDAPSLNPAVAFPATFFPVPFQTLPTQGSTIQFFVTEVSTNRPGASGITYSTYFGGGGVPAGAVAIGGGIAVDSTGNIYFSGTTNFYNSGQGSFGDSGSEDFPILNAYQPCLDTPPPTVLSNPNPCSAPATTPYPTDAFVAKLNPNNAQTGGAQLLFSTYLGGTGTDSGTAIAIDSGAANIYLTGSTNSSDFVLPISTTLAFQDCLNNPGVVVTSTSLCPATTSNTDAYVARLSNPALSTTGTPNNVALTYFSYLGGGGNDSGLAIAVDTTSDALVTGTTNSGSNSVVNNPPNFPVTPGPIQSVLNGAQNAFFARIDTTTTTGQNGVGSYATYFGGNGVDRGTSIAIDPFLNTYFAGDTTSSTNFETVNPLPGPGGSTLNGPSDAFAVKLGPENDLCITCVAPVLSQLGTVSAGNQLTITFTVANEGPDPATGIFVNGTVPAGGGVTFVSATAGSGTCSAPSGNAVVCQIPTLQSGSNSAVTFTVTPNNSGNYAATATVVNVNNTITNITTSAPFAVGGYAVSISPSAQTVTAGSTAQYSVQLSPTQGAFGDSISLTCSAAPTGAGCAFTNSTITLNGSSSASTILNLTTTPQPVTTVGSRAWQRPLYALWLMVPGMAVLGLGAGGKRRGWGKSGRLLGLLALSVLFALVLLQPSCSSGNKTPPLVSGTPSGTYPFTVTATSGSFTRSASFSLTVIP